MSWRVAESLEKLRRQLNAAFPNRSKVSDGGIGDAKHASRSSDHNPYIKDRNGFGVVTARDFTHDPKNGLDCNKLAEWLIESRDPRIKYIIWNRRILSSQNTAWKWRPYTGVNAHTKHLHLSVNADAKLYDSAKEWDLDVAVTLPEVPKKPAASLVKPFNNITDDEINEALSFENVPANEPVSSSNANLTDSSDSIPPADLPVAQTPEQPQTAGTEQSATQTTETGDTKTETTVAVKNEQDVNQTTSVSNPTPYNEIGFWATIKRDLAAVFGTNATIQTAAEYTTQAQQTVPASLLTKLAYVIAAVSVCYLLFRVVHFAVDSWKKNQRAKLEATINTDINRKNMEWTG